MNKVINFLQKYLVIISILIGVSILLGLSYSSFFVTSDNHKAAEMYIGELKYSMTIDNESKNTLTVPSGETIIDLTVNSLDSVDTYYKLLYLKNSNIEIKYYGSTKDTDEVVTTYNKPNDSVVANNSNNIKLLIINNSETDQTIELVLKGGYITNTLSDISIPTNYSQITTIETPSSNTYFCNTTDTLTQGLEYVNGQYTYGYMEEGKYSISGLAWQNISNDGWGVQLTDKTSTEPVTSKVCTYINNKPVVSMSNMFYGSQATTLDVSKLNTSNVTNMTGMFSGTIATTLDVSNFDTSNVTDMTGMFSSSKATSIDLNNFNTSNVTNMEYMFFGSQAVTLDLSSFNTSNVTNMTGMFSYSKVTALNLSNFDTSKVTDMVQMFHYSEVTELDLSSFDTHNVTNMHVMFNDSKNLKTIYASDKFNTDAVPADTNMFAGCTSLVGGSGTKYDSTKVDKTYARIDDGTSSPGYFTQSTAFATNSWSKIIANAKAGNISAYSVGDTKEVDLGEYGTHTLRIANTSTPSECYTDGFSQTACGFVLEFADIITTHQMNPAGEYSGRNYNFGYNIGGWPNTTMRTFVNNDIYNALPTELKNGIIDTTVVSSHGSIDLNNFTSTDKLYLLSGEEIYEGFSESYDTSKGTSRQLDYYKNAGVTTSNYSGTIKLNGTSADWWWLRSAYSSYNSSFFIVHSDGLYIGNDSYSTLGVSPAFRIG